MTVWMMVSKDKYELPLAVADSAPQLAEMVGVSANAIFSSYSCYKNGKHKFSRFHKVEIEEVDDETDE